MTESMYSSNLLFCWG